MTLKKKQKKQSEMTLKKNKKNKKKQSEMTLKIKKMNFYDAFSLILGCIFKTICLITRIKPVT